MVKFKSLKFSNLLKITKGSLIAIVVTILGIIALAVVLKFTNLNSMAISYINDIIKAISLFIMILILKKSDDGKLLFKAILGGLLYSIFCFLIFSILNGSLSINMSFVYDIIFAVIVSVLITLIINILKRKAY